MARADHHGFRPPGGGGTARTTAALLGSLTLLAAAAVLWLVWTAVENERLATRQRWREAGQLRLDSAARRLRESWSQRLAAAGQYGAMPPPEAFAAIAGDRLADSALVRSPGGAAPDYPAPPGSPASPLAAGTPAPASAEIIPPPPELEALDAALTHRLTAGAGAATDWLDAQRQLLAAGKPDAALAISRGFFQARRDGSLPGGRMAAPASDLMVLRALHKAGTPLPEWLTGRLRDELSVYKNTALPSSQRRFLMVETANLLGSTLGERFPVTPALRKAAAAQRLLDYSPAALFPTFAAEDLAQRYLSGSGAADAVPCGPYGPGVTLLFTRARLTAQLLASSGDTGLRMLPPGSVSGAEDLQTEIHPSLPGWRVALDPRPGGPGSGASRLLTFGAVGAGVTLLLGALTFLTWRHVRRQMRRARLQEEMAATVSHELRTPVASMRVLVESLLEEENPDAVRTREYLQLIARENTRLNRLVTNFLTLARLERRRADDSGDPPTVAEILDATAQAAAAAGHGPRLRITGPVPSARVSADAAELETALLNLIDNACKYAPPGTPVDLSATLDPAARRVSFSVTDRGPGLSREQRARVWEPFERLTATSAAQPGCGLGLAIVKRVAERAGGSVQVRSNAPETGCVFLIHLPATGEKGFRFQGSESRAVRGEGVL